MSKQTQMDDLERTAKLFEIASVFTPSAPIDNRSLFAGRIPQLRAAINAITQKGQHAIVFGERGVGKTSLASVLFEFIPTQEGTTTVRINCDTGMTFDALIRNIIQEFSITREKAGLGFRPKAQKEMSSLESFVPKGETITPSMVRRIFQQLEGSRTIIIIDELDRIEDKQTINALCDTIKALSDHTLPITFILVGVADSVDQLIEEHRSVERALVQIHMPRMSRDELLQILEKGFSRTQMIADDNVKEQIVSIARGLPHYVHLLALHSAQEAVENGRLNIDLQDFNHALKTAISQAQESIQSAYYKAINSPKGNLYRQVLLACVMANKDEMGFFSAGDIRAPLSEIMGKKYEIASFARHLKEFCSKERGPALERRGHPRKYRYRFFNPLLEPFILMKGREEGLISATN